MTNKLLAATMLLGISGSVIAASRDVHGSAPPACRVQGVWDMVASVQAGKRTEFTGAQQRKIVTKKHWMWLAGSARRDTLPMRTALDTANYYSISGGTGPMMSPVTTTPSTSSSSSIRNYREKVLQLRAASKVTSGSTLTCRAISAPGLVPRPCRGTASRKSSGA